jgi:translation initiation factor 5
MANDVFIINGSHDESKLISLLYDFIRKFVLCYKCNNPETIIEKSLYNNIRLICTACGHETTLNKANYKLTNFIRKHPIKETSDIGIGSLKTKNNSINSFKSEHWSAPQNLIINKNESQSMDDRLNEEFHDFDQNDISTDESFKRIRKIFDGFSSDICKNDFKRESCNLFYEMVKEKKEVNLLLDTKIQKGLLEEAERLNIKDKSTLILSELLFTENILEEIKKYRSILLRFCLGNKKAQKYLLRGYEKLVGDVYKEKLFDNAVYILKKFYDEEILDEDAIIEWSVKASKKYLNKDMSKKLHEKVAPLIKWLRETEEEILDLQKIEFGNNKSKSNALQTGQENIKDEIDIVFSYKSKNICEFYVESSKELKNVPINANIVFNAVDHTNNDQNEIDIDNI